MLFLNNAIRRVHPLIMMLALLAAWFASPALARPATAAEPVQIDRDAKGVPHIFARTAPAVMFGLGYALAHDRLAAMELRRRAALGTRAEVLGPSAVEGDKVARDRLLSRAELMRMFGAIPAEHQAMLRAFVAGYNRHVDELAAAPPVRTPYQFTQWGVRPARWTLLDYLAIIASFPNDRGGSERQNAAFLRAMIARHGPIAGRQIFEDVVPLNDPDSPTVIPPGEDRAPPQPLPRPGSAELFSDMGAASRSGDGPATDVTPREASRCLVIGPKRSASGHVLMLQETADGPESHLYGGGFDTAGFALTGWGPPIMGRSLDHGWLLTSGVADTTDTFAEKLNPADRRQYWFKGAWRTMQHRIETIKVKDAAPVQHEVAATIHGPVVAWDAANGTAYTERYAVRGHEIDNWVAGINMARARSLAEFEQTGIARVAWNLGICYGDTAGHIAFWEAGLLPIRAPGADSRLPTPGTGEYEWQGFLSLAQRPRMIDPAQGFFHAWNSKATGWSREGDDARLGKTFRTWLGNALAQSSDRVTLADMRRFNHAINTAIGGPDRTAAPPWFYAVYLAAAADQASDPEIKEAIKLMLAFDGRYEDTDGDDFYDSPGLPLFRAWLTAAPQLIFGPTIDDWWSKADEGRYLRYQSSLLLRALQGRSAGLPLAFDYWQGRSRDAVLANSVRKVIDTLRPQFGDKPLAAWRQPIYWKYLDPARKSASRPPFPDPDAPGPRLGAVLGLTPDAVPHSGGDEWTGLMELDPTGPRSIETVIEAGGQNLTIDGAGQGNPHLADQVWLHANDQFKTIEMTPAVVHPAAETSQTIAYAPR